MIPARSKLSAQAGNHLTTDRRGKGKKQADSRHKGARILHPEKVLVLVPVLVLVLVLVLAPILTLEVVVVVVVVVEVGRWHIENSGVFQAHQKKKIGRSVRRRWVIVFRLA